MTTTSQSIIDKVRLLLVDPSGLRWSDDELRGWLNDAQLQTTVLKPDALSVTAVLTLDTGTLQTLPAAASRLLRVVRNMSAASEGTGGRAVRLVDRETLDAQNPNWHDPTSTGLSAHGTVIKNYIYDEQDPLSFYVFPGVSGDAFIEVVYSKIPDNIANLTGNIELPDIYAPALVDYIMFRAYMKEGESANVALAQIHYQLYAEALGAKIQLDGTASPNARRTGSASGVRTDG
jgi:hypothetical protein